MSTSSEWESLLGVQLDDERARYVKGLRTAGYTWRAIAAECGKKWNVSEWNGMQHYGEWLCRASAARLNEDFQQAPWP